MSILRPDTEEWRLLRIEDATRDWLESQVFPTTAVVSQRVPRQPRKGVITPTRVVVEIDASFFPVSIEQKAA
jgi:hypothetical protein